MLRLLSTHGRARERALQLDIQLGRLLLRHLVLLVRITHRRARHFDRRRQELDQTLELDQTVLERHVARHLELHADAESVHTIRVVHRPHREQILEEVAIAAVVGDLHVAVDATTKRVLDHRDRLGLRLRTLQEAAVAPLRLGLVIARHASKLAVDEEHRVARNRHVRQHDASRVRLRNLSERVHPSCHVWRHLVAFPQKLVRDAHLTHGTADHLLDEWEARLRLHELGERRRRDALQRRAGRLRQLAHRLHAVGVLLPQVTLAQLERRRLLLLGPLLRKLRGQHEELELHRIIGPVLRQPAPKGGHVFWLRAQGT
mmetsp:Transcript_36590/g.96580  ORF Transcript_36590/g.96580 Transcript_36590/m.96580 type:complete len:316 (+) Transcript_36590:236-1183(+)